MTADPKEKASGFDRKRAYTAAAALLVAGAAGHFMQRTTGDSGSPVMVSATIPAVSAPEILAAAPETTGGDVVAAAVPEAAPAVGADMTAPAEDPMAEATAVEPAEDPVAEIAAAPAVTRPKPKPAVPTYAEEDELVAMLQEKQAETAVRVEAATGIPSTAIYPAPKADPALEEVTRAASDPLLTITEAKPERAEDSVFAAASDPQGLPPATAVAPAEPEIAGCAIDVQGTARPGALLEITVAAPCHSGESVGFEHAGLRFSEQLGPDGSLVVAVPAMTGAARVALNFADGTDREVEVALPDFDAFDRIAIVWQGATGLQLHALEGGADYGEAGHVWADTPGTPEAAIAGTGGFVTVLGSTSSGYAADVYTYPAALMRQGAEPEVSIEAQVMENTCGGKIEGAILRSNPNRDPNVEPLTMMVPGCDAVGEYLVLRDLPVQLELARR